MRSYYLLLPILLVTSGGIDSVYASNGSPLGNLFGKFSSANADGGWFWGGWLWGADSVVSVVDRTPTISFPSRPASFGTAFEDAVMGYGIPMNAFTVPCPRNETLARDLDNSSSAFNIGCPRLCPGRGHLPEVSDSWIAIVQRGKCSFVSKIREAQRFGAKAVVVGGDDPDVAGNPNSLLTMYSQGDASDVKIPSTFIKFSDYVRLSELIASSSTSTSGIRTVSLQITSEFATWEWYSPILTFVVLLLLPSSLTLVTLLIHRVRAARAARRERAPEDVVNNLPWIVWSGACWEKQDQRRAGTNTFAATVDLEYGVPEAEQRRRPNNSVDEESGTGVGGDAEQASCLPSTSQGKGEEAAHPWFEAQAECAICLSDFEKGDHVRILPCKHIFHMEEVDEWLIHRKKLCPVCKADVTVPPSSSSAAQVSVIVDAGPEQASLASRPSSVSDHATERTPLLHSQPLHGRSNEETHEDTHDASTVHPASDRALEV